MDDFGWRPDADSDSDAHGNGHHYGDSTYSYQNGDAYSYEPGHAYYRDPYLLLERWSAIWAFGGSGLLPALRRDFYQWSATYAANDWSAMPSAERQPDAKRPPYGHKYAEGYCCSLCHCESDSDSEYSHCKPNPNADTNVRLRDRDASFKGDRGSAKGS